MPLDQPRARWIARVREQPPFCGACKGMWPDTERAPRSVRGAFCLRAKGSIHVPVPGVAVISPSSCTCMSWYSSPSIACPGNGTSAQY